MENNDTTSLLKECNAGSKMAVSTIDAIIESVKNEKLKSLLSDTKAHHEKLGNKIHEELLAHDCEDKDPSPLAKSMSYLKTNVKLGMDATDETAAALITEGCDMGIKTLYQYLNKYDQADHSAKDLCERLISIEDTLRKDMYAYL